ncbi:uncharacterized protein Z518_00654 [Rhinocladiella mackenziei CBS 650.93]|uniref:Uncharacterized protein n=1 Tax=Rhinocladiella mackenziei CBS 650.93 TaxID=1442369 RepID=A0A0D2IU35_9EURO|nr:uncharacterized protein Z518_00654 [Rhinocladiella mackenziei CBS 650.93]KIX09574.1 hypothetical protein Z518_00654 [Rhinocladiella mackenziei CBS 650.93]
MSASYGQPGAFSSSRPPKLRTACNNCHSAKVRSGSMSGSGATDSNRAPDALELTLRASIAFRWSDECKVVLPSHENLDIPTDNELGVRRRQVPDSSDAEERLVPTREVSPQDRSSSNSSATRAATPLEQPDNTVNPTATVYPSPLNTSTDRIDSAKVQSPSCNLATSLDSFRANQPPNSAANETIQPTSDYTPEQWLPELAASQSVASPFDFDMGVNEPPSLSSPFNFGSLSAGGLGSPFDFTLGTEFEMQECGAQPTSVGPTAPTTPTGDSRCDFCWMSNACELMQLCKGQIQSVDKALACCKATLMQLHQLIDTYTNGAAGRKLSLDMLICFGIMLLHHVAEVYGQLASSIQAPDAANRMILPVMGCGALELNVADQRQLFCIIFRKEVDNGLRAVKRLWKPLQDMRGAKSDHSLQAGSILLQIGRQLKSVSMRL